MVASSAMAAGFTFLSGAYYNGYFFGDPSYFTTNTEAFSRLDSFIAFTDGSTSPPVVNWNFTGTPLDGVTDRFSVRWKGLLQVDTAGTYSFKTVSDDGIIVYLDDAVVISNPPELLIFYILALYFTYLIVSSSNSFIIMVPTQ
jgi:hypothetical protein